MILFPKIVMQLTMMCVIKDIAHDNLALKAYICVLHSIINSSDTIEKEKLLDRLIHQYQKMISDNDDISDGFFDYDAIKAVRFIVN